MTNTMTMADYYARFGSKLRAACRQLVEETTFPFTTRKRTEQMDTYGYFPSEAKGQVTINFTGALGAGKTVLSQYICETLLAAGFDVCVGEDDDTIEVETTQHLLSRARCITQSGVTVNDPSASSSAYGPFRHINATALAPSITAHQILTNTAALVSGDRALQHGDKRENHQNIADLFNAYLGVHARYDINVSGAAHKNGRAYGPFRHNGMLFRPLDPTDIALLMDLVKTARTKSGTYNPDDYADKTGYAAIAGELAEGDRK